MSGMQRGREDVTIIMVGSSPAPEGPLKPTANAVLLARPRAASTYYLFDDLVVISPHPLPAASASAARPGLLDQRLGPRA